MSFKRIGNSQPFWMRRRGNPARLTVRKSQWAQNHRAIAQFSLSPELLKEMRWLIGDRVEVLVDATARLGLIKRVRDGGWKISAKISDAHKNAVAFSTRGVVSITPDADDLRVLFGACDRYAPQNITISDEGIVFEIPKATEMSKE